MYSVFLVIIVVVSLLLILVVMVQNPKGGGLSSEFGGTQMMGGVQKTGDFLDKSTWTLSILLMALMLISNTLIKFSSNSSLEDSGLIKSRQPIKKEIPKNLPNTK